MSEDESVLDKQVFKDYTGKYYLRILRDCKSGNEMALNVINKSLNYFWFYCHDGKNIFFSLFIVVSYIAPRAFTQEI